VSHGRPAQCLPVRARRTRSLRLGKTKGYQNLKDREVVPPPVITHPDRWRLDQLLAWEEKRMALAEAALEALTSPGREAVSITDLLPQPKRRQRSA
jgi:hypothetical protein